MARKELVIATKNKGKLREIKALLADTDIDVTSLADYPDAPDVIEDGKTFGQNALKKAATIALFTGKLVIGEDSGIQIKALNNAPGIYSARFSGPNANDQKNNAKMLRMLKDIPDEERQARYRCAMAIVDGRKSSKMTNHVIDIVEGQCSGWITRNARGKNGFGYDPYFLLKRYNQTFGELPPEIKSKISHRARALKKIRPIILKLYG